jgi:hypothetical protein
LQVDQLGHGAQFFDARTDFGADRMIDAVVVEVCQSIAKVQPDIPNVLRGSAQVMVLHDRNSTRQIARIHADCSVKALQVQQ